MILRLELAKLHGCRGCSWDLRLLTDWVPKHDASIGKEKRYFITDCTRFWKGYRRRETNSDGDKPDCQMMRRVYNCIWALTKAWETKFLFTWANHKHFYFFTMISHLAWNCTSTNDISNHIRVDSNATYFITKKLQEWDNTVFYHSMSAIIYGVTPSCL